MTGGGGGQLLNTNSAGRPHQLLDKGNTPTSWQCVRNASRAMKRSLEEASFRKECSTVQLVTNLSHAPVEFSTKLRPRRKCLFGTLFCLPLESRFMN